MAVPSDLEIARGANLKPLTEVAEDAGIPVEHLESYGTGSAKISLDAITAMAGRPKAKYVVVTAITPTPLGEGKTTTTVGLGQGFCAELKQLARPSSEYLTWRQGAQHAAQTSQAPMEVG